MKKSLLLSAAVAMTISASAQVTSCWMDVAALGYTKDAVDIAENKLLCEDANGAMYLAFSDQGKVFSPAGKGYSEVSFDGGDFVKIVDGLTGSTNPSFTSFADGAPTAGWVFKYTAKKDGVLTVLTKLNSNKQYIVFEGKTSPISYTLGVQTPSNKIQYTLPADKDGYLDLTAADADKYFIFPANEDGTPTGEPATKPKTPGNTVGLGNVGEGSGFLQFNVYEGVDYYINALGSKMCSNGFTFSEKPVSVSFKGAEVEPVTFEVGGSASVAGIEAANEADAPIYNMMGVRVNADAKGILIQNGKKFIRK